MTEGTDYTVSYTNNVNAGTATVTITGIGQYTGTLTKTFTISAKTVTPTVTLAATTYTYDGTAKQPSVTVKDGSTTLATTDYTVAYSNNVKVGTSTATVTLKGNYSGSATASYSIKAKAITPTVTLSRTSFVYNGKEQKPAVTVKDRTGTLPASVYDITYSGTCKKVGTYKVIVTLKGNYSGSAAASYSIKAKAITPTVTLSKTSFVYTGKEQKPSVTVKDGNTTLAATDYTVAYSNNVNVGTSTATVTLKGNYSGSAAASYSIKAKAITPTVTLSKTSFVFNGKEQKPAVTVKDGTGTLPASVYDITYSGTCKNVGTYKVTVTLKGNYSGSATASYSIIKLTVTLSKTSFTYTGKVQKPAVTTVKDGTSTLPALVYAITYSGTCKNTGAYKVIVTLKGNYSGTVTRNFSIVKAQNPMTVKTANKTVKIATVKKKAVTVKAITVSKAQGTVTYKKESGKSCFTVNTITGKITVKKGTPKGTYTVKVRVTAKGNNNYKSLIKTVSMRIVVK